MYYVCDYRFDYLKGYHIGLYKQNFEHKLVPSVLTFVSH